ncbi:MAG: hypothetical protein EON60_11435, partial [Alphaproteobacteria bacterium]
MSRITHKAAVADLIFNLEKYEAFDPMEQTHKLHTLHALKTVDDLFERSCLAPGHATATAWV